MKKYLILMLAAAAALVSCGKETLAPETVQATPITFNLSANHPDATKAVKSGWENSAVATGTYTVNEPQAPDTVAAPVITPAGDLARGAKKPRAGRGFW